jgi:hypothetical protein
MKSSDRRATDELLIATIEAAVTRGCQHYSEKGELLATTLAVLECLQREGFVTVEKPGTPKPCPRSPVKRTSADRRQKFSALLKMLRAGLT